MLIWKRIMTHSNGTRTAEKLLIKRLKVSGLLSFGPTGIDLPMRGLNVLIGANGSGKSNFIEVIGLLHALPKGLPRPDRGLGSLREWMWKGDPSKGIPSATEAVISAVITGSPKRPDLRHEIGICLSDAWFGISHELIQDEKGRGSSQRPVKHYGFSARGKPTLYDPKRQTSPVRAKHVHSDESILAQVKDPDHYPALARLQEGYQSMRLYRDWSFGPTSPQRLEQDLGGNSEFLENRGRNLALVFKDINNRILRAGSVDDWKVWIDKIYAGIDKVSTVTNSMNGQGTVQLIMVEDGARLIGAQHLSDGTLRYLSLLAILLHPKPPELLVIEEPELGLHPDLIHIVADLLKQASKRTQLIVTTHSRGLVEALGDQPESIVVCEKYDGQSTFERLDGARMKHWLDRYNLGELWSSGELGGNRW